MSQKWLYLLLFICSTLAHSAELSFDFKSPAFSGIGYGSHALTVYQLEENKKQKLKDEAKAVEDRALRDTQSTNAYKFKNNLESRIYAQLSKQIADQLFGEGATIADSVWYSAETPFGDTIKWMRDSGRIYVKVVNSSGNTIAEFDVPVGEFAF